MKYYVYVYRDPRTMLPFYVGKGCGDRMFRHLLETFETTENRKKYGVIAGLRNKGLEPIIGRYAKNLSEEAAYALEEQLIQRWGRRGFEDGGLLTNICIYQRPPCPRGRKYSEEQRIRMSEAKKGNRNPMFGKIIPDETKALLSAKLSGTSNPFHGKTHSVESKRIMGYKSKAFHTGRTRSEETKQRMREAQLGKPVSETTRLKISNCLKGHKQSEETISKRAAKQVGRDRPSKKWVWTFYAPDGQKFETDSLLAFCREHNLSIDALRKKENSGKKWNGWLVTKTSK